MFKVGDTVLWQRDRKVYRIKAVGSDSEIGRLAIQLDSEEWVWADESAVVPYTSAEPVELHSEMRALPNFDQSDVD